MNRIVLIGNGFDLAHGLKTSYKNFIDWYWKDWGEKLLDEYYEEKHRIRDTWREYETYTKIDVHPDPEGSKRGRPI